MSILANLSHSLLATSADLGPGVLVVDDEPALGDMLKSCLEMEGFRPIVARGGQEAIEVYKQHHDEIALVLLDVRMPDLSGPETMRALQNFDPEVRCCFMSGDLGNFTPEELKTRGAQHVFVKPFPPGEPAATLRRLTATDD